MQPTYPNLIMEPSTVTFWLIFTVMALAVFLIVPYSCFKLKKAKLENESHPSLNELKKVLIFEAISFTLCLILYLFSVFSAFTNY